MFSILHQNCNISTLFMQYFTMVQIFYDIVIKPDNISPVSCKYFAPSFIQRPLSYQRPPKYQNLWVSIFPVENYHSLS